MSAEAHPAGFRHRLRPPSWFRVFEGVVAGMLLAVLPIAGVRALLAAAGLSVSGWSVGAVIYAVVGAVVWAVCVRFMVARLTWRTVSFVELVGICLLAPVVTAVGGNLALSLVPLGVVLLLVRYRSAPDARLLPSAGERLAGQSALS